MMSKKVRKILFKMGLLTAAVHGFNRILFSYATRKQILNRYGGKYFKTKYGNMFYHVYGNMDNENVLLLVHDLSCVSSGYEWNKVIRTLSETYKVYVVDLLGCGRSDKPEISYTPYFYVQLLQSFIKKEIRRKAYIVAAGRSGSIVTYLKAMDNEIIEKTLVINPELNQVISYVSEKNNKWIKCIYELPVLGTFLYNFSMSRNLIEEKFEDEYFYKTNSVRNKLIDAYYESSHLSGASSRFLFSSLKAHYLDLNIECALKKMDENYMVLIGAHYKKSEKILEQYSFLNPSISIITVDNTKYLPQLEAPESICKSILEFMKE